MQRSEIIIGKIRDKGTQKYALSVVCACALCCTGCFTRRAPANNAPLFAFAHPVIPATAGTAQLEAAPDLFVEIAVPPRLISLRSAPLRPRVAQAAPVEPSVTQQPADPIIVPELSTEQLNSARSETQHSLEIAEWNLAQTQGKKLNVTQEDVASKIRGFMDTAREAMKNSDWQRAKNMAKKAEVLSHELVANL